MALTQILLMRLYEQLCIIILLRARYVPGMILSTLHILLWFFNMQVKDTDIVLLL